MRRLPPVFLGLWLLATAAVAECIPPLEADELMLSIVKPEDESGRGDRLEIFANGRVRLVLGCHERETWLDSWAVEQIPRSLLPVFHKRTDPIPQPDSSRESKVTLHRFDVEADAPRQSTFLDRELTEPAWAEVLRIQDWSRSQARLPVWVTGPWPPRVCWPDVRRDWGLGVEQPPWCGMRMSLFPPGWDEETFRERLRERLKELPRGLQDAGENSEN